MTSYAAVTHDIKVTVRPVYLDGQSEALSRKFVFAYFIRIENLGADSVQLLRRHWIIKHSSGKTEEVEGEGVIGKQPDQSRPFPRVQQLLHSGDDGREYGRILSDAAIQRRAVQRDYSSLFPPGFGQLMKTVRTKVLTTKYSSSNFDSHSFPHTRKSAPTRPRPTGPVVEQAGMCHRISIHSGGTKEFRLLLSSGVIMRSPT